MKDVQKYIAEIEIYYAEAEAEYKLEHYHLVVGNLMYAKNILEEIGEAEHQLMGKIFHLLTKTHRRMKHFEKAHEMWEKTFHFYCGKDTLTEVDLYHTQGVIFSEEKKDKKAVKSYMMALELLKNDKSVEGLLLKHSCLYNLGNCHLRLGEYANAKENYRRLSRSLPWGVNNTLKGKVLMGLGYIYHVEEKLNLAERRYYMARKYLDPDKDVIAYGRASHNLGEVLLAKGEKEKARILFMESLQPENVRKVDKGRVTSSLCSIGFTYLGEDLAKVKQYCVDALNLAIGGTVTKFSMTDEQELGRVFLLFCHILCSEGNFTDLKIYIAQAETIFIKYNMLMELNQLANLKNKYLKEEVKNE